MLIQGPEFLFGSLLVCWCVYALSLGPQIHKQFLKLVVIRSIKGHVMEVGKHLYRIKLQALNGPTGQRIHVRAVSAVVWFSDLYLSGLLDFRGFCAVCQALLAEF